MRVTVGMIAGLVASGRTTAEILTAYPYIEEEDIRQALAYAVACGRDRGSASDSMKLLIDMNLSPLWVEFFAASGFESIHWSKVGEPTAPDCLIMDYAAANGFIIFTHDLDFGALPADRKSRQPSVIQIRTQDVLPVAIGPIVVRALKASQPQLEEGALATVDPGRNRIRLLPLCSRGPREAGVTWSEKGFAWGVEQTANFVGFAPRPRRAAIGRDALWFMTYS